MSYLLKAESAAPSSLFQSIRDLESDSQKAIDGTREKTNAIFQAESSALECISSQQRQAHAVDNQFIEKERVRIDQHLHAHQGAFNASVGAARQIFQDERDSFHSSLSNRRQQFAAEHQLAMQELERQRQELLTGLPAAVEQSCDFSEPKPSRLSSLQTPSLSMQTGYGQLYEDRRATLPQYSEVNAKHQSTIQQQRQRLGPNALTLSHATNQQQQLSLPTLSLPSLTLPTSYEQLYEGRKVGVPQHLEEKKDEDARFAK